MAEVKSKFCEALRRAGAEVQHTIVVFYYDIFPETKATMKKHDLTLHYLATWWDVLEVCKEANAFDSQTLNEVESFLNEPIKWSGRLMVVQPKLPNSKT